MHLNDILKEIKIHSNWNTISVYPVLCCAVIC